MEVLKLKKLLGCIAAVSVLAGCAANSQSADDGSRNLVNVKNSTITKDSRESEQEISRHLVDLAERVPNVKDAAAVVFAGYAIVGIDVDKDIDRSEVGSIKYSVTESLRNDPHGARALVVADPDLNARIREVGQDIQNGRPIQGILNELADITGRIMPEVPGDITDPQPKDATEEPKNKLNEAERSQLEDKQQKQSNYHKD
jgi:YhcN/YlaJ family sporulation lipoprotein